MTDQKEPETLAEDALEEVQGAGPLVGSPARTRLDDGQPLVEVKKRKPVTRGLMSGAAGGTNI